MRAGKKFLIVEGHANYAPKGEDIVCAAVSSLVLGSYNIWSKEKRVNCTIFTNKLSFEFNNPTNKIKYECAFLKKHLKLIAEKYPAYVEYVEEG